RGGLGVDLAALQADPPVDAVRPVAEPPVGDGDRADPGRDTGRACAAQEDLTVTADRVRAVRVAVRVAPRPGVAGHRQFLLELLVVRPQLWVAERPVGAHAIGGGGPKSAGG